MTETLASEKVCNLSVVNILQVSVTIKFKVHFVPGMIDKDCLSSLIFACLSIRSGINVINDYTIPDYRYT